MLAENLFCTVTEGKWVKRLGGEGFNLWGNFQNQCDWVETKENIVRYFVSLQIQIFFYPTFFPR